MRDFLLSLLGGVVVGILFSIVKLPLPAPPLVGIFGMIGIYLGGIMMDSAFNKRKLAKTSKVISNQPSN